MIHQSALERALRRRRQMLDMLDRPHLRALTKQYDLVSSISKQMETVQQAQALYDRFIYPDKVWVSQLHKVAEYRRSAENLGLTNKRILEFANGIQRLSHPWLNAANPATSVTSILEIYSMAAELNDRQPFGRLVTNVLRRNLGDWRRVTAIPERLATDPNARFDFYTEQGFNDNLTDLPVDAFIEILDSSGFRGGDLPGPVEGYGPELPVISDEDMDDDVPDENIDAYQLIFVLETNLRSFIDEQMTQQFGHQWVMQRIPPEMHQEWQKRRRIAIDKGEVEQKLIAYADFTDYIDIICKKDNWKSVFERFFKRKSNIQESFTRLYPVRLSTMHSRVIIPEDLLLAHAEVRRILRAIQFALG